MNTNNASSSCSPGCLIIASVVIILMLIVGLCSSPTTESGSHTSTGSRSASANKSSSQVYKFKSTLTDVEVSGKATRSVQETCYHTFDFDQLQVIYEGVNSQGEKVKIIYPMKSFYKEGVTYVIVVNDKGMSEIWFSVVANNLGYDLLDGKTRMACYELTRLK